MTPDAELQTIAIEGYAYFYPLMVMEESRRQMTNGSGGMHGPTNSLVHVRAYPGAQDRVVVRPNFDTLYSAAFLDVRAEPVLVSAPALADRFFMLPLYDMWTDAFAAPGSRTNGSGDVAFAVCMPEWRGGLPAGVERIDAPTPVVWLIGRTQTNGPADYEKIHAFQDSMKLMPLSAWPGPAARSRPRRIRRLARRNRRRWWPRSPARSSSRAGGARRRVFATPHRLQPARAVGAARHPRR